MRNWQKGFLKKKRKKEHRTNTELVYEHKEEKSTNGTCPQIKISFSSQTELYIIRLKKKPNQTYNKSFVDNATVALHLCTKQQDTEIALQKKQSGGKKKKKILPHSWQQRSNKTSVVLQALVTQVRSGNSPPLMYRKSQDTHITGRTHSEGGPSRAHSHSPQSARRWKKKQSRATFPRRSQSPQFWGRTWVCQRYSHAT